DQEANGKLWRDPATILGLSALLVLMLVASQRFVLQEDEVLIYSQAMRPLGEVLARFLGGPGQHVHPPLSDLLLGLWIRLAGHHWDVLRLPNVIAFVAGVGLVAETARRLHGGVAAGRAVVALALVWPYGVHSGWMFGWYSIAFLQVAALTLTYTAYRRQPSGGLLALLILWSVILAWTNYFGLVLIGLLGIEFLIGHRKDRRIPWPPLLAWAAVTALSLLPLMTAFTNAWNERVGGEARGIVGRLAYGAWNGWLAIGGESIAPWAMPWSALALLGCGAAVLSGLLAGRGAARAALLGFALSLAVLALIGQSGAKRILFLTPWLLLGLGMLAVEMSGRIHRVFIAGLSLTLGIGWLGVAIPESYATLRFSDPWYEVASVSRSWIDDGGTVIGNHPTLFHLIGRTYFDSLGAAVLEPGAAPPGTIDAGAMTPPSLDGLQRVLLVESAGFVARQERADLIFGRIRENCDRKWSRGLLPDNAAAFKNRFAAESSHRSYRIVLTAYECARPAGDD
ncbi:MAG TPA: glycosyltransferase family 39 protein, partial [Gemmatimonadales bacterium]|nr:glycosyltransferase family 39 protein [Gemmatimonadales bacterium]